MHELAPPIEAAYQQSLDLVGDNDPYAGSGCLGIKDVLKAHYLIADHFHNQGGSVGGLGPKSIDLLHSALYRQHISYDGTQKWSTKYDICATLFFGLIKDHPFHDANKRTAFLSLIYHLDTLNLYPTVSEKELEDLAVSIADNKLSQYRRYKELCNKFGDEDDASVNFISHFLRKNSRRIDKRHYSVTYRDLKRILNRFGFDLKNPRGNTIDVVRIKEQRNIFRIFRHKKEVDVKVSQIGFPNWTSQVGRKAINTVRSSTQLTADNGVDSQTFFKDADPVSILISKYEKPLQHLADR